MTYPATILLVLVLSPLTPASGLGWLLSEEVKNNAELELLKKIEIERMKANFMQVLGLKKIPVAKNTTRDLSDSVLQLLLADDEQPVKQQRNLAKLLIFPLNGDFNCEGNSSSSCQRFQYEITQGAVYSTEFWFLKLPSSTSGKPTVSVLCSYLGDEHDRVVALHPLPQEVKDNEWASLRLTGLKQFSQWKGNLSCAVEVKDIVVSEDGNNLPFLKLVHGLDAHDRTRRSLDSTAEHNDSCKPISFTVTFDNIGFEAFIIYPKSYDATLCAGYCLKSQTMHETLVDLVFNRNTSLEREHGRCWSTCCKPKTYGSLRVMHREEDRNGAEIVNDQLIPNMVVESCWCN